jgi:uncharacterized protein (DUF433 family)
MKMDLKNRIVLDPKILTGKPTIRETRIAVEFIIDLLAGGWTIEQVLQEYDHLTREDIQACLMYVSDMLHAERVYPPPDAKFKEITINEISGQ